MKKGDKLLLNKLVEYLILNNNGDIGLFRGKMGLIICLCEYGRYVNSPIYIDIAAQWTDDIAADVHASLPIDVEVGLCGLGIGFDYLIRHGYMEGDIDNVLSDFDRLIMERDVRRITDYSLRRGLAGIVYYATIRLLSNVHRDTLTVFDSLYLFDLKTAVENSKRYVDKESMELSIFNFFLFYLNSDPSLLYNEMLLPNLFPLFEGMKKVEINHLGRYPKGLDRGVAGTILQMIQKEKNAYLYF